MITLNGISSILGSFGGTGTTTASNKTQIGATRLEKYNKRAKELLTEHDTNNNNSLNLAEASPLIKDKMMTGTLNAERLQQVFEALARNGMSQVELSRSLQLADENEDGTVSSAELEAFGDTLKTKLTNGQDPEKLYAQLSAKALKAGGAESTGAELTTLEKLFKKYNIAKSDYTPTEGDTDADSNPWAKLLGAVPGLIGSFQNNSGGGSSSVPSLPSLASMANLSAGIPQVSPPPSFAEMARLAGLTGATNLNGQPINPFLPSPALGTNVFGGASAINPLLAGSAGLPTAFNPLLAGSAGLPTAFNPLTAGSAQQPFAQTNFVPSVVAPAVAPSGFSFTPATPPVATVGTAQALPTGVAATTPAVNPAVTSWAPAPSTLLAQALPQVPAQPPVQTTANGGW
jgi:hypothetical protein